MWLDTAAFLKASLPSWNGDVGDACLTPVCLNSLLGMRESQIYQP